MSARRTWENPQRRGGRTRRPISVWPPVRRDGRRGVHRRISHARYCLSCPPAVRVVCPAPAVIVASRSARDFLAAARPPRVPPAKRYRTPPSPSLRTASRRVHVDRDDDCTHALIVRTRFTAAMTTTSHVALWVKIRPARNDRRREPDGRFFFS